MTRKTQATQRKEATKAAKEKAEAVPASVETRPDASEPGEQVDDQGLAPVQEAEASESGEKINTPPQGPNAKGKKDDIPALFIRTTRRYKSRRRAGFRFTREGHGIALDALTDEQIEQLTNDPALEVEECTFPAEAEA